jgi:hypothetical protein
MALDKQANEAYVKDVKTAADSNTASNTAAPARATPDVNTDALVKVELALWEARIANRKPGISLPGKIEVFNSDRLDVNLKQIKAGMARYRDFGPYTQDARDECLYQKAETQAKDARNQYVVTNLLNPPSWILGTWNNSRESNSDRFETFKFSTDDILFSRGLLDTSTIVNFHSKYEDYAVKEIIEPGLYRIEFSKGKNEIVFEFKLCELEHCKTPSTSGALTYSIIRNGRVVRAHETSIQHVLFRWRST